MSVRRGKETEYSLADDHVAHIACDAIAHGNEPARPLPDDHDTDEEHTRMSTHTVHDDHTHTHGEGCGHVAIAHGEHTGYLHDGHVHAAHNDHWDEH